MSSATTANVAGFHAMEQRRVVDRRQLPREQQQQQQPQQQQQQQQQQRGDRKQQQQRGDHHQQQQCGDQQQQRGDQQQQQQRGDQQQQQQQQEQRGDQQQQQQKQRGDQQQQQQQQEQRGDQQQQQQKQRGDQQQQQQQQEQRGDQQQQQQKQRGDQQQQQQQQEQRGDQQQQQQKQRGDQQQQQQQQRGDQQRQPNRRPRIRAGDGSGGASHRGKEYSTAESGHQQQRRAAPHQPTAQRRERAVAEYAERDSRSADVADNQRQEWISPTHCVICCNESDLFAVGDCLHPVCFECATRIRVIGGDTNCSYCRAQMPVVWIVPFTGDWNEWRPPPVNDAFPDKRGDRFGIKFANKQALGAFNDILAHVCTVCSPEEEFATFVDLRRHMSRVHELFYCDLCADNLQLFSWERKCYTRKDLATHRRVGDADDRSHRGHPSCQLCDERFLDNDHLYLHLRRDHFYCQLCDADGTNIYYAVFDELRQHYKVKHFLCEEGACKHEPHGIVFRTEIDLKGHKATHHKQGKQAIQLDFNYSDRVRPDQPQQQSFAGRRGGGARGSRQAQAAANPRFPSEQQQPALVSSDSTNSAAPGNRFTGSRVRSTPREQHSPNGTVTTTQQSRGSEASKFNMQQADFPTLEGMPSGAQQSFVPGAYAQRNTTYPGNRTLRRSDSLDDFPALVPVKKADSSRSGLPSVGSSPRLSSMAAQAQSQQPRQPPATSNAKQSVMIDDDEDDIVPYAPQHQHQKQQQQQRQSTADVSPPSLPRQEAKPPVSALNNFLSGSWARPKNLADAANFLSSTGENQFPSLASNRGGSSGARNSAWSSNRLSSSLSNQIVGCRVPSSGSTSRSKALPEPDIWPKMLKDAKPTDEPSTAETLSKKQEGGMLKLETTTKVKARRVAQQKQRQSSECEHVENGDGDVAKVMNERAVMPPPPPGFENHPHPSDPPAAVGTTHTGPPPGFDNHAMVSSSSSSIITTAATGTAATAASSSSEYNRPNGFADRNRSLFNALQYNMRTDALDQFKAVSSRFRKGDLEADRYLSEIRDLLGPQFDDIISELICLLPDIGKQRSLLEAYVKLCEQQQQQQQQQRGNKPWASSAGGDTLKIVGNTRFRLCVSCGQVLNDADFASHTASHSWSSSFPTL